MRRVNQGDLLLRERRHLPHVRRWWGEPEIEPEEDKLADPRIRMWIAGHQGDPFAFLQDYDPHDWDPHPFAHLSPGSRGIDLYLGSQPMVGAGHGTALIRQFLEMLFEEGWPAVGTDPHPQNLRARRAFEKAGFVETSGCVETRWGRAVLMECRR